MGGPAEGREVKMRSEDEITDVGYRRQGGNVADPDRDGVVGGEFQLSLSVSREDIIQFGGEKAPRNSVDGIGFPESPFFEIFLAHGGEPQALVEEEAGEVTIDIEICRRRHNAFVFYAGAPAGLGAEAEGRVDLGRSERTDGVRPGGEGELILRAVRIRIACFSHIFLILETAQVADLIIVYGAGIVVIVEIVGEGRYEAGAPAMPGKIKRQIEPEPPEDVSFGIPGSYEAYPEAVFGGLQMEGVDVVPEGLPFVDIETSLHGDWKSLVGQAQMSCIT